MLKKKKSKSPDKVWENLWVEIMILKKTKHYLNFKKKNSKYEISNLATPKSPYMGNLTGFD